jgi:hypothetical protein
MKGKISIGDFIHKVRDDLVEAQEGKGMSFYELSEVTLEVASALEATANAGFNLYVVELGGESKAQQTHKVSMRLTPLRSANLVSPDVEPVAIEKPDSGRQEINPPSAPTNFAAGSGCRVCWYERPALRIRLQ